MQIENMRLDANAAAGTLRELFARDVTTAITTCAGCGKRGALGSLLEYGQAMGVILRCPACDRAMLRIARTPGWMHVDASGIAMMVMPDGGAARS